MSFDGLLTKTARIYRRGPATSTDVYGNLDETEDPAWTEYPCWHEQTTAVEVLNGRETVLSDSLLILPPEAEVDRTDRVDVDGQSREVVGLPVRVDTPRGIHHVECRLRAVSG